MTKTYYYLKTFFYKLICSIHPNKCSTMFACLIKCLVLFQTFDNHPRIPYAQVDMLIYIPEKDNITFKGR